MYLSWGRASGVGSGFGGEVGGIFSWMGDLGLAGVIWVPGLGSV